jgi:hypothetical protein
VAQSPITRLTGVDLLASSSICAADPVFECSRVSNWSASRVCLRAYMKVSLILILGGLTLGCATVGAIGIYLLLSRPYRKARNRLAILFGQVIIAVSALTSLGT